MKIEAITKSSDQGIQNFIISKIRDHINNKNLEPGEKLPSERFLSEKLKVSRNNVREAIQKLEFYGLLKSRPQSGTFVANIDIIALNGMVDGILKLNEPDIIAFLETRVLLELKTVSLAALRRTDEDLKQIKIALDTFESKVLNGENAKQEDLLFHLAIAKASRNNLLESLILFVSSKIMSNLEKYHVCDENKRFAEISNLKSVYDSIEKKSPQLAKKYMENHLKCCINTDRNTK